MHTAQAYIANLCKLHARDLEPTPIGEPKQILWAFAGVESSFGQNFAPRHESSYCRRGKYYDAALTREHGCLAHCSFGPWQVMFPNFPTGTTPHDLLDELAGPELGVKAAIRRINLALRQGASDLAQLADAYNSGNFRDTLVPTEYVNEFLTKYQIQMPLPAAVGA